MGTANPFAGIGGAKASRDANYVTPGHYVMRLDGVWVRPNRLGNDNFIVEMMPLHVLAEDPCTMNGKPTFSNKKGIPCSHLVPFVGKGAEMALPNIKGFAECCVEGFAEAQDEVDENGNVQEQILKLIVTDDQPLSGLMVEVIARSIRTKSDSDFTKITYVEVVDDAWRLKRGLITQEEYDLLAKSEG
jgi:hypothetical protein